MKICLHTNWEINQGFIGGTERFLIDLSKELEALGHEPFIVCSSKTDEINIQGIKVFGRFFDISENASNYQYFSSKFIKNEIIGSKYSKESLQRLSNYTKLQLEGIEADIFHLNSFISAAFLEPKPNYVITNHENNQEYDWYWGDGFFDFFKSLVENRRTNLHHFKNLYVPSSYYAEYFSKQFNIPVRNVNLGVSLNNFILENKENSLKKELSIAGDEIIILLPSRFQPYQKGHDIALKACALIKERGIKFKMIFTGVKKSSEKYKSGFDDMVHELGLQKYVKVITFPKIQEAYRNTDIVISPERYCSYGLSISESLAQGIPTVLSDIPTYKEVAGTFKHAFFFKNESANDLSNAILKAINYVERNRTEAIRFRTKYDLRRCSYKYSEIYSDCVTI